MITIDRPILKEAANVRSAKKILKKEPRKNSISIDAPTTETSDCVSSVNPFLFLQEIDEYVEDQRKLKEFGNAALRNLKELRLALINGELSRKSILQLQFMLQQERFKLKSSELQKIMDEISMRVDIELVKLSRTW